MSGPMIAAGREVVAYLTQRGLLDERAVFDGEVLVVESSRRNRNVQIVVQPGPSLLLKQGIDPVRAASVAHEAAIYRLLRDPAMAQLELGRYLPALYGYDEQARALLLEFFPAAEDLHAYHLRHGRLPAAIASSLGDALGTLHRAPELAGDDTDARDLPPCQLPIPLALHRPDRSIYFQLSAASIELVTLIQRSKPLCQQLDKLHADWSAASPALIHGDLRWDNCLAVPDPAGGHKPAVKIVDWELAGLGDPCWDTGAFLGEYLRSWVCSIPITEDAPPDRHLALACYPLEAMRPGIRAFWRSYSRRRALDDEQRERWLVRSARYAGAWLIEVAFEHAQMQVRLDGSGLCLLQVAMNILRRPRDAVTHLLGIPLAPTSEPAGDV